MPPFQMRPHGLSAETTSLLDDGLTLMWLNQVSIGAAAQGETLSPVATACINRLKSRAGSGVRRDRRTRVIAGAQLHPKGRKFRKVGELK